MSREQIVHTVSSRGELKVKLSQAVDRSVLSPSFSNTRSIWVLTLAMPTYLGGEVDRSRDKQSGGSEVRAVWMESTEQHGQKKRIVVF